MKKLLLLVVCLITLTALKAQTTLFSEDWSNGLGDWEIENLGTSPEEWEIVPINPGFLTTGDNGTLFAYGFNSAAGTTHNGHTVATSPTIDCSNSQFVILEFEQIFEQIQRNSTCTIEATTDGSTWTEVYSNTAAVAPSKTELNISDVAAGAENLQIRFVFVSTADYYWIIDDIAVLEAPEFGAAALEASMYDMSNGAEAIYESKDGTFGGNLTIKNLGSTEITSVAIEYTLNGNTESVTISDLSLDLLEETEVSLETILDTDNPGIFPAEFTITQVNGVADTEMGDNTVTTDIILYDDATAFDRKPLLEVFTSSSCGPCKPGNERIHSIMDVKDREEYVLIKYQQNFPGAGDPYFTDEALARRQFYGVNSIPNLQVDGSWDSNPGGFTNGIYTPYLDIPAINDIDIEYTVDEETQTVDYTVTINSGFDFPDNAAVLHIAIVEELTDNNVATNGEREFEQVMKKMIDGAEGTPLTGVTAANPLVITGSYTFNGDYRLPADASDQIDHATEHSVEEFNDLGIVAFIQHANSNQIFGAEDVIPSQQVGIQDAEVSFFGLAAGPNPFEGSFNLNVNSEKAAEMNVHIVDATGRTVYRGERNITAGSNSMQINLDNIAAGIYEVLVTADGITETIKVSKL